MCFSINSFVNQINSSPEGQLFRHPLKGFVVKANGRIHYLVSHDMMAARREANELLGTHWQQVFAAFTTFQENRRA
jgi:hypothetical protein